MASAEGPLEREERTSLVRRMACGDAVATREVYDAFCDPVLRFVARRIGGSVEDAEEITIDVFLGAMDLGGTYDGSCSILTWLCAIANNRVVDFRRRAGAAKRVPQRKLVMVDDHTDASLRCMHDPSARVDDLVEQMDRVALLHALLDTLSFEQRQAVTMRYVEGFSVAETARIMKRSPKAVERLLERAKERPRKMLLGLFGDQGMRGRLMEMLTL